MRGEEWEKLELSLQPTGPQRVPIDSMIATRHEHLLALRPPNPDKDRLPDPLDGEFFYDVALAESLIANGTIAPQRISTFPTSWARKTWGVTCGGGVVRQAEGSNLDLIWVLRMPALRAAEACVLIEDRGGELRLLDGAHRLTRAYIDGLQSVSAIIISAEDAELFRKSR